jgi:hypothetical protein
MKFRIPENLTEPSIQIHSDFYLIAACNINYVDSLSPVLLNRFTLVNLDNQLSNFDDQITKKLIKYFLNQI